MTPPSNHQGPNPLPGTVTKLPPIPQGTSVFTYIDRTESH